jgi:hypothetical protein
MNKKVIDNDRADVGRGAVVDPFVVFIYGALMPFVPYDFVSPFLPSIDAVLLQLLEIVLKLISIFFACWLGGRIFVALIYRVSAKWGKRLDVLLVAVVPAPVVWTRFCNSGGQLYQLVLTGFKG